MVLIGSRRRVLRCVCGHPDTDHLDPHPVDRVAWCTWPGCGCSWIEPQADQK